MEEVIEKLNNSPDIYYIPFPEKSSKIYLDVFIKEGFSQEPSRGITHLMEHYLWEKYQEASDFKTETNAGVDPECTYFYIESDEKNILQESRIFLDNVFGVHDFQDKKTLNQEKLVATNELRGNLDSLEKRILNSLRSTALGKDCKFIRDYEREIENTKKFKLRDIEKRYNSTFSDKKVVITIGGYNISQKILNELKNKILSFDFSNSSEPEYKSYKLKSYKFKKVPVEGIKNVYPALIFPAPSMEDPVKIRVLTNFILKMLVDSSNKNVFAKLREKGDYGVEYETYFYQKFGLMVIHGLTEKNKVKNFIDVITEGIENIKSKGFDKSVLEKKIKTTKEGERKAWNNNSKRYNWITEDIITNNKIYTLERSIKTLNSINNKEIKKTAKEIFDFNTVSKLSAE